MSKKAVGRLLDRYEIDQRIVESIVMYPNLTIDGIANQTGLSYTAVRNSLQRLVSLGVVVEAMDSESPTRRGRPARYFKIDKGLELFIPPRQFQHLAFMLVEQIIQEHGLEHIASLLNRAAKLQVERLTFEWKQTKTHPKNLEQMIQAICDYLNQQGCYAKHTPFEKGYYIQVSNCVYHRIAASYPRTICRYHESFITYMVHYHDKALGITHEETMADGAHHCRYVIERT